MRRKTNTFKHLDQLHDFSEKDRGHGFILLRKLYVNDPGSAGLTQQHSKSTGPQATLTFRNLSHAKNKKRKTRNLISTSSGALTVPGLPSPSGEGNTGIS